MKRTTSKVLVTAYFESWKDGYWWLIVRHGCIVEHIRLVDEDNGPTVLRDNFGIPLPQAKKMCAAVKP